VIALCNPKNIRFDQYEPLTKQIAIPGDTLSRFGLVFKIQDIPNVVNDKAIAEHQARQWARYETGIQEQPEEGSLSQEKLSKYLQYAKTIKPRTTPETREEIMNYFLTLRTTGDNGTIATTARQNNDLYRLTKAIAKLRLSDTCSMGDVEMAIQIHKASLEALRDPKTGKIDIDIIFGSSTTQRDRLKQIIHIIKDMQDSNSTGAHFQDIILKAADKNIKRDQVTSDVQHLKQAGDIIEVSSGFYRVV